ncbi:acetyl-CoA ligase [Schizosaccharomyces japonicus yFS275]|uniref:Acetyl-CoA ligase n=1 Tax=Schizosaccharomyces japonicus (strain yFS275 / FY16936) TaxID=402676 RepID=B6JX21_SCHJY|nr:acetyl-CoA ligase [Schizosaccharomyces japonicus yFS275]EEB05922.1 acetyl-CoA ligase [Schizosaccharomyces japonicus yFS275]
MATTLFTALRGESNDLAVVDTYLNAKLSYAEFRIAVMDLQRQLANLGISKGDPINIVIPNGLEFVVAFFATSWQRGLCGPLNANYKQKEFEFYMEDLKSKLVLVPYGAIAAKHPAVAAASHLGIQFAELRYDSTSKRIVIASVHGPSVGKPQPLALPQPSDVTLVLHTSGTTGRPKVVPLTHANLCTTLRNIITAYRLDSRDRSYVVMPLFHVHGLVCGLLSTLGSGGCAVIPKRFSAHSFWKEFVENEATWYTAVPTIHHILLNTPVPNPLPRIRFIRSCSSPLAATVLTKLEETFRAPVLEAYAMTEAAHQMTTNPLPPAVHKPGTVGLPFGVELRILDNDGNSVPQGQTGEISVRGTNVTKGYLNNPSANASSFTSSGFFRTGDEGFLDKDGFVVITGRIKELVNRGGEKISPAEVDAVVVQHPKVNEAVSFAVPDEKYGQDIQCAIVVRQNETVTPEELKQFLSTRISAFKIPKKFYFTQTIPKTATGKVQRRLVCEAFFMKSKAKL